MLDIIIDAYSIIGSISIICGTFLVLSVKIIDNRIQKNDSKLSKINEEKNIAETQRKKNLCVQCVQFKF